MEKFIRWRNNRRRSTQRLNQIATDFVIEPSETQYADQDTNPTVGGMYINGVPYIKKKDDDGRVVAFAVAAY